MSDDKSGMAVELSGAKKVLFTISMFLLSFAVMGEMGVMPITANIYDLFGYGLLANYIVSAAALWMAIGAVLSTRMMATMTKKKILLIGSVAFAIGSIFCASVINGVYIAVMRSLMGLGEGIINTVAMAYIAQMYVDEAKRASFTGYFNAAGTVLGAALSYAAGVFSIPEWTHTFYVFFPMVLITICAAAFIPELGMEKVDAAFGQEASGKKEPLGKLYATFIVDYVIFVGMYAMIAYFISVYIAETGIGDASFAGLVLSISSIAGFFTAAGFGAIYKRLSKSSVIPALTAAVIALAALYFVRVPLVCTIACGLVGLAYGVYFSYTYAYPTEIVPVSRINDAMGYTTAIYSLAFFATPFLTTAVSGALFAGSVLPMYGIWAALGLVAIVIELATNGAFKRHQAESASASAGEAQA